MLRFPPHQPGDRIAVADRTRAPMDETKGYRDHLLTKSYRTGDVVRVLSRYVNHVIPQRFETDGTEGTYVIVAEAPSGHSSGREYKIARFDRALMASDRIAIAECCARHNDWDLVVNTSRLERVS